VLAQALPGGALVGREGRRDGRCEVAPGQWIAPFLILAQEDQPVLLQLFEQAEAGAGLGVDPVDLDRLAFAGQQA